MALRWRTWLNFMMIMSAPFSSSTGPSEGQQTSIHQPGPVPPADLQSAFCPMITFVFVSHQAFTPLRSFLLITCLIFSRSWSGEANELILKLFLNIAIRVFASLRWILGSLALSWVCLFFSSSIRRWLYLCICSVSWNMNHMEMLQNTSDIRASLLINAHVVWEMISKGRMRSSFNSRELWIMLNPFEFFHVRRQADTLYTWLLNSWIIYLKCLCYSKEEASVQLNFHYCNESSSHYGDENTNAQIYRGQFAVEANSDPVTKESYHLSPYWV